MLARDLIKQSTQQLWDTLQPGTYQLQFDDTTITTNHKEILYSSYFWEFHRKYPNLPILSRHHVQHVLKGKMLNSETHMRLLEVVYWDTAAAYNLNTPQSRIALTKMIYEVTNTIYNELSNRLEAHVVSLDILDFIEVIDHPAIKEKQLALEPTDQSIGDIYKTIIDSLHNAPELSHNRLARAVKAKMVKENQVLQCVGPRGKVTEVDGFIMPIPILRSFTTGMRTLYNMSLESRSASKSLFFSEAPLQDTDYFARRLQLITTAVEKIIYEDCGSTDYTLWRVRGKETEGDETIYPGDLVFISGKYYLDDATNTLIEITERDTHLIGKTLKLRTVLGCKHTNPHTVCSVCFGGLSRNISPHANIGHVSAATMTYQTMQSVLSIKHLNASSASENIPLTDIAKRFLRVGNKRDTLFITHEWRNKPLSMVVSQDEAYGLTDILLVDDVSDINASRVSSIEIIEMVIPVNGNNERHPIPVNYHGRRVMLSNDFLQYIKLHGWEHDDNGNFVLSFDKWDFTKPILLIPQKEYSFAKHASEISMIIESRIKDITGRSKPDSPKSTLVELFELVNSKLFVNIACLELIIYAMMCKNVTNDEFSLTHHTDTPGLGVSSQIIHNRSLSAAYAFEEQAVTINDPTSFFKLDRTDSIFDTFFNPQEVLQST